MIRYGLTKVHEAAVAERALASDALSEAEAFLEQRDRVSEKLEAELATAQREHESLGRRIRVLQDTLARVRGSSRYLPSLQMLKLQGDANTEEEPLDLSGATNPEAIWFAVAAHPQGITANGIQQWVASHGRELPTRYMHTYLHRMLKDGRLLTHGEKGHRLYLLAPTKEGSMPAE